MLIVDSMKKAWKECYFFRPGKGKLHRLSYQTNQSLDVPPELNKYIIVMKEKRIYVGKSLFCRLKAQRAGVPLRDLFWLRWVAHTWAVPGMDVLGMLQTTQLAGVEVVWGSKSSVSQLCFTLYLYRIYSSGVLSSMAAMSWGEQEVLLLTYQWMSHPKLFFQFIWLSWLAKSLSFSTNT